MDVKKIKWIRCFVFLIVFQFLQGCASSELSRSAGRSIDNVYLDTKGSSTSRTAAGSVGDSYQNSTQASKGAIIGGVTGGVVGGMTNGIGAVAGTITGAILGGALGAYIDAHTSLLDKIQNRGGKVFVLGDQVLIVLPSTRLFDQSTPNIRSTSYSTLDVIAELIGNYSNISVKVAAYTDSHDAPEVDRVLSQQQADRVARYLWKRGVNTRVLFSMGYGATHLISKSGQGGACNENNRIEITFEKLPAVC